MNPKRCYKITGISFFILSFLLSICFSQTTQKKKEADIEVKTSKNESKEEAIKPESHKKIEDAEQPAESKQVKMKTSIVPEDTTKLKEAPEKDIVAKVGDTYIRKKAFEGQVAILVGQYKDYPENLKGQLAQSLKNEAMEFLVLNELLLIEAKKRNITISDEDIKKEMDSFIANIDGGKGKLDEIFKKYDITEEEFKSRLKKEMLLKKMMVIICESERSPSDKEISDFYEKNKDLFSIPEQIRVSQILIKKDASNNEEENQKRRKKIEDLLKKAKSGEDFAALAKENSECASAPKGGDLGYNIHKKDYISGAKFPFLPEKIEKVAFALKKDEISGVFEDESGYHILKITDRLEARMPALSEVKKEISDTLIEERQISLFNKWSAEALKTTPYEIYKNGFVEEKK